MKNGDGGRLAISVQRALYRERGEGNRESGREGVRHEGGGKVVPRGSGE